jgi:ATP synthase F1 gamma subunit
MIEETKKRLENIQAIEPYLNAMRNTSLGSWKTALNRIQAIHRYRSELLEILDVLNNEVESQPVPDPATPQNWVVIGSQKGLVSNFNRHLLDLLEEEIEDLTARLQTALPTVILISNRPSYFYSFFSKYTLQPEIVPFDYNLTHHSAARLAKKVASFAPDGSALFYFYNQYAKSQNSIPVRQGSYQTAAALKTEKETERGSWPPYLLDSDAALLWEKIHDMLATLEFQEILTNSIASENAFRHRILEEAKNNTDRLISELSIELAMARKKEITKEIQELAVAAGLVQ